MTCLKAMTPARKSRKSPIEATNKEKRLFSVYNKREFLSALMLTNCNPNKELIVEARFHATPEKREAVKGINFLNEVSTTFINQISF